MSDQMTLDKFRQARESGVDLYAEEQQVQEDAAPEKSEVEEHQEDVDHVEEEQVEDEPQIPESQQSAWQKRAERERRKGAEEAESRLKSEHESELSKYKRFFDASGINPDDAIRALEQNRINQEARNAVSGEAQRMAYQNGWSDVETEEYISRQADLITRQRQQENEMRDLRVAVAINDLADKSDFPGIKSMKGQIAEFVRSNPSVSVEQAYWAVGGASLAQQLKRETEQREIAKRSQATRKVVTDAGVSSDNKSSLPPEAVEFMRREGMTEAQVRNLMGDGPKNLAEYRKMNRGK